ncbi:MAG: PepSY-associated TM helix domain-containing protein [Bryobacterales bacterium]|nr:PepSY-associated TM helix domain-containing protein [Bryobacterales bacterium]
MASFVIVFFFAATGLTLNHADWFSAHQRTVQLRGTMDPRWLRAAGEQRLHVVEHLRGAHQVRGALSDFRPDDTQLSVSFKGPGYTADAIIDRASGRYELTETRLGLGAVMNDLHKGRDTGRAWAWLIDISAVVMCFVSLTGLVLLFYLSKRRLPGLLVAAAGAAVCYGLYVLYVP